MGALYQEETVMTMLLAAYQAGFEGPLELSEETCRDIMAKHTSKESDLQLMTYMQDRGEKKEKQQNSLKKPAAPAHGAAPDKFDEYGLDA